MPSRKRSTGPRSAPKLFQCTGYGNCDMVFTRSEHLARHERKHTGEKPYACIVPSCDRRFSRFDNMMQHTQTHEKTKHASVTKPPTPIKSEPVVPSVECTLDNVPASMVESRELPLPFPMPRRASLACTSAMYNMPYPPPQHAQQNTPGNRCSWPIRREPSLYQQPSYQPHVATTQHESRRRSSTTSSQSSESTVIVSPVASHIGHHHVSRRRISMDDLGLPIEDLKNIQLEKSTKLDAVDITLDEFEALEGFSQFHTKSVVAPMPCSPTELTPVLRNESPNFASQVCAMRQRVMALNESFSRR